MKPLSSGRALSRRRFLRIAAGASALLGAGRLSPELFAADTRSRVISWRGIALGTEVGIDLFCADARAGRETLQACGREIRRLEAIFSLYDAHSSIGQLNRAGRVLSPPGELLELFDYAGRFHAATQGAFDISIQPLCAELARADEPALEDRVQRARELVDFGQVEWDSQEVRFRRPGMQVTCNGIAQGFITDRIADLLVARGFDRTLVDLGEKRVLGPHPAERPWRIGIESPADRAILAGTVELNDAALATSGGYGATYAGGSQQHLLDARTGTSRRDFASVTVVAPRAVLADALSTSVAVMADHEVGGFLSAFPACRSFVVERPDGALVPWRGVAG